MAQIFSVYVNVYMCRVHAPEFKKTTSGAVPVLKKQKTKTQTNKITNNNKNMIEELAL